MQVSFRFSPAVAPAECLSVILREGAILYEDAILREGAILQERDSVQGGCSPGTLVADGSHLLPHTAHLQ